MTGDRFRVLDLFSGIGGFSLGLERAGMETVAFCEQDGYACRVLRKHWPTVPIFEDVRTLTKSRLKKHGIDANVICGGFPCQDISTAGKGAGIDGERSGLWREYARLIREIRPAYAIMENVAALRSRGLDRVLGNLAAIGYDAEWHCIPASAVGAPHQRDRVWIVAHAASRDAGRILGGSHDSEESSGSGFRPGFFDKPGDGRPALPNTSGSGYKAQPGQCREPLPDSGRLGCAAKRGGGGGKDQAGQSAGLGHIRSWPPEPDLPRVADGVPHRVDRLRCLGNAVVPQIVEMIGRAIVQSSCDQLTTRT